MISQRHPVDTDSRVVRGAKQEYGMAWTIVIGQERSVGAAWAFDVVMRGDGEERACRAQLSWADYDYWCGGATSPADVTRAALETALLGLAPSTLGERLDLSTLRRLCAGFDTALRARLGRSPLGCHGDWADEEQQLRRAG